MVCNWNHSSGNVKKCEFSECKLDLKNIHVLNSVNVSTPIFRAVETKWNTNFVDNGMFYKKIKNVENMFYFMQDSNFKR